MPHPLLFAAILAVSIAGSVALNHIVKSPCIAANYAHEVPTNGKSSYVQDDIKQWQAIVLISSFGAFALFWSLMHRTIR